MQNIESNTVSVPQPQHNPTVLQQQAKRSSGGLRTAAILGLALMIAVVFSVGMFAGWEFGNSSARQGTAIVQTSTNGETVREAVIAKLRQTVVQVNVVTKSGTGLGSGVIIDQRGFIVTNNHVIDGAQRIQVLLYDDKELPAQLVGADPSNDLAVLKVATSGIKLAVAPLGDSSQLRVGQDVLAIGNPLGITQTVTSGIVSALGRTVSNIPDLIQTDAAINPGNSGGALIDLQGDLVGIPTLAPIDPEFKTPANGVGFALSSNLVKLIVPQLTATGMVRN